MRRGIAGTVVAGCASATVALAQGRLEHGELWVELDRFGLVDETPAGGVVTVDGPPVHLRPGSREWYGVHFEDDARVVEAFAGERDWGRRTPVELVSFRTTGKRARAVARVGGMQIETDFWFDPLGPYLVCGFTLRNVGEATLRNVLYTRECRPDDSGRPGWTFPDDIHGVIEAPEDLVRSVWMFDYLRPGAEAGGGVAYALPRPEGPAPGPVDVPLALWTNPDFPGGLVFGQTNGVSFGDYDADGFIDVFALMEGNLWENVGGTTWTLAADLDSVLPATGRRYGSSFGDYDADGLPDIGTEPRNGWGGDECVHLLHALGGTSYQDVATDPAIIDVQACNADAETICWGDVDGDADLDMFLPTYPPWSAGASASNFFYKNLGPTGPGGAHRFEECATECGFFNPPPDSARPEGAQFVDVDFDGDMDLYSNGHLYQNDSSVGAPLMNWQTEEGSGILYHEVLEEGAAFGDYDLDGDFDLFIVYTPAARGVRIFENHGDGTFFDVEDGVIDSRTIGLNLGLSAEDWDNDGDIDFTTRQIFRRNMLMETGERHFIVATTSIPGGHITSATPAWGDWDKDGDLDSALGNWLSVGRLYENTTYGAGTPDEARRYVRVRPLRDSEIVPAGLETEYATTVEIDVLGETAFRRKKFTSSSAGYLNQSEYTLHFALPDDPAPADPDEDVRFDVIVDFPSLPEQGFRRVDKHVNPALGDVDLSDLGEREIVVFRSGKVILNGSLHLPGAAETPLLTTAGGGLVSADPVEPMGGLTVPPTLEHWVGLDFDTLGAASPVRIREILFDGQLGPAVDCGLGAGNFHLWDVTSSPPALVASQAEASAERNRRSFFTTDVLLQVERRYRLVARANLIRETVVAAPIAHGDLTVNGGLSYRDRDPCSGARMEIAPVDPTQLYLTLRFGPVGAVESYCQATVTSSGAAARMAAFGSLSVARNEFSLGVSGGPAGQNGLFFYASGRVEIPFGDGFLCAGGGQLFRLNPPQVMGAGGAALRRVDFGVPPAAGSITPGSSWNFQFWFRDPAAGGAGFNLSDGLGVTFQP